MLLFGLVALAPLLVVGDGIPPFSHRFVGSPTLPISVGTPAQGAFPFHWSPLMSDYGQLTPAISLRSASGLFDPNESKTFRDFGPTGTDGSVAGADTLKIQNGPTLVVSPINVLHRPWQWGYVDWGKGTEANPSFMDRLLKQLDGKESVVLAIDESRDYFHNGTLILGDTRPAICTGVVWSYYRTHRQSYIQMAIDTISSGSVSLAFDTDFIWFDAKNYANALRVLNVGQNGEIDCNIKTNITIKTGRTQNDWTLSPKDYVKQWDEDRCEFTILKSAANAILLPLRFLNKRCLQFDFRNNVIALGSIRF